MTPTEDAPPPGFVVEYPDEPFETHVGPHYLLSDSEAVVGGFRASHIHLNSNGVVHGGALSALADSILPVCVLRKIDCENFWVATISLNCEFVSAAKLGDWIECHCSLTRLTRSLAFVSGQLMVEERVVMNCSTVLKVSPIRR